MHTDHELAMKIIVINTPYAASINGCNLFINVIELYCEFLIKSKTKNSQY